MYTTTLKLKQTLGGQRAHLLCYGEALHGVQGGDGGSHDQQAVNGSLLCSFRACSGCMRGWVCACRHLPYLLGNDSGSLNHHFCSFFFTQHVFI